MGQPGRAHTAASRRPLTLFLFYRELDLGSCFALHTILPRFHHLVQPRKQWILT